MNKEFDRIEEKPEEDKEDIAIRNDKQISKQEE